jgi:hypothetical protein
MIRRLMLFGLLAGAVAVAVQSAPDLARYLKLRSM